MEQAFLEALAFIAVETGMRIERKCKNEGYDFDNWEVSDFILEKAKEQKEYLTAPDLGNVVCFSEKVFEQLIESGLVHKVMVKCTFVSVWDCGTEIETPAKVHLHTGELVVDSIDVDDYDLNMLEREYIILGDDEFEVCSECHEYITNSRVVCGIGMNFDEIKSCRNTECENCV